MSSNLSSRWLFVVLIMLLLVSAPVKSGDYEWTLITPVGGVATHFVEDNGVIYAASNTRLFKSEDRGDSWTPIRDFGQTITGLNTRLTVAVQGDVILVTPNFDGLWRSADGGATWARVNEFGTSQLFLSIVASPHGPIYASHTSAGFIVSHDAGLTWAPTGTAPGHVNAMAFHPVNPNIIYAGLSVNGVSVTTDGGVSWSPANTGLPTHISRLAISSDGATLLAAEGPTGTIYRSTDGGASWHARTLLATTSRVEGLIFDSTDSDVAYVGLFAEAYSNVPRIHRTADGGNTWSTVSAPDGFYGPETRGLHLSQGAPQRLIAGTTRGLFLSEDSGAIWSPANAGFSNTAVYGFSTSAAEPDVLWATSWPRVWYAGQDGIYRSADGGANWDYVVSNIPLFSTGFLGIGADPAIAGRVVVSRRVVGAAAGLYVTTNGGSTWSPGVDSWSVRSATSFEFDPVNMNTIYALAQGDTSVFVSSDGGGNWSEHGTGLPDSGNSMNINDRRQFVRSTTDSDVWYAATLEGIYRSDDNGVTWAARPIAGNNLALAVAVSPVDEDVVYAGFRWEEGLYRSTDGGLNWTVVTVGQGIVMGVEFDENDPQRMLVLTIPMAAPHASRVSGSIDGGSTWVGLSGNLANWMPSNQGDDTRGFVTFDPSRATRYYASINGALQVFDGGIASDLSVTAGASPASLETGGQTEVSFAVSNDAGDPASDLVLQITFPATLTFQAVSMGAVVCNVVSRTVTCPIDELDSGASLSGTLELQAASAGAGAVSVNVVATTPDSSAANNTAQASVLVTAPPQPPTTPPTTPPTSSGGGSLGFGWLLMLLAMLAARVMRNTRVRQSQA